MRVHKTPTPWEGKGPPSSRLTSLSKARRYSFFRLFCLFSCVRAWSALPRSYNDTTRGLNWQGIKPREMTLAQYFKVCTPTQKNFPPLQRRGRASQCLLGAVIGGMVLGLLDGIVPVIFGSTVAAIAPLIIVVIILVVRPQGLFGHE